MMAKDPNKKKGSNIAKLVVEALKASKLALPETDQEIADAEKDFERNPSPLPSGLADPFAFLDSSVRFKLGAPVVAPMSAATELELARAAREGGKLTPEIEARMRADRAAAKAQGADDEED